MRVQQGPRARSASDDRDAGGVAEVASADVRTGRCAADSTFSRQIEVDRLTVHVASLRALWRETPLPQRGDRSPRELRVIVARHHADVLHAAIGRDRELQVHARMYRAIAQCRWI